jgi:hypothetical protein
MTSNGSGGQSAAGLGATDLDRPRASRAASWKPAPRRGPADSAGGLRLAHGLSGVEGPKKVRSTPFEVVSNSMNFFRPVPRPRPFRVLLKPCSPQGGEDQQPTSGAGMGATGPGTEDPRCTKHPAVTLVVHPRRWGWVCPKCRMVDPAAVPFVPLPSLRPTQAVPVELDIWPVPRSASVPSPRPEPGHRRHSHQSVVAGQLALALASNKRAIPRTEEARGSNHLHP